MIRAALLVLVLVGCVHSADLGYSAGTVCQAARTPPGCAAVAYCSAPDLRWFAVGGEEPDAVCRPDDQRCLEAALEAAIASSCGAR